MTATHNIHPALKLTHTAAHGSSWQATAALPAGTELINSQPLRSSVFTVSDQPTAAAADGERKEVKAPDKPLLELALQILHQSAPTSSSSSSSASAYEALSYHLPSSRGVQLPNDLCGYTHQQWRTAISKCQTNAAMVGVGESAEGHTRYRLYLRGSNYDEVTRLRSSKMDEG